MPHRVVVSAGTALPDVHGPIGTLLVAGGLPAPADGDGTAAPVPEIRRLAGESGRVGAICSGALLLAEAGLLEGRRATTHWAAGTCWPATIRTCGWTPIASTYATATCGRRRPPPPGSPRWCAPS